MIVSSEIRSSTRLPARNSTCDLFTFFFSFFLGIRKIKTSSGPQKIYWTYFIETPAVAYSLLWHVYFHHFTAGFFFWGGKSCSHKNLFTPNCVGVPEKPEHCSWWDASLFSHISAPIKNHKITREKMCIWVNRLFRQLKCLTVEDIVQTTATLFGPLWTGSI